MNEAFLRKKEDGFIVYPDKVRPIKRIYFGEVIFTGEHGNNFLQRLENSNARISRFITRNIDLRLANFLTKYSMKR